MTTLRQIAEARPHMKELEDNPKHETLRLTRNGPSQIAFSRVA